MVEPEVEEVHQHTFYEVLWVEEGRSTQVIDYSAFPIVPGSLFFISPGQVHHFEDWQHLKGGSLFFQADFLSLPSHNPSNPFDFIFLDNRYASPVFSPPEQDWQAILRVLHQMETESHRNQPSLTIQQGFLQAVLAMIERSWRENQPEVPAVRAIQLFKQFKKLLDETVYHGYTAQYYAERLHITPHHLNSIAQKVADRSTSQVIRDRTILEAQRLLTFTDLTATEIAHLLHLTDSSWFAKIFRQATGQSPTEFRKQTASTYQQLRQ